MPRRTKRSKTKTARNEKYTDYRRRQVDSPVGWACEGQAANTEVQRPEREPDLIESARDKFAVPFIDSTPCGPSAEVADREEGSVLTIMTPRWGTNMRSLATQDPLQQDSVGDLEEPRYYSESPKIEITLRRIRDQLTAFCFRDALSAQQLDPGCCTHDTSPQHPPDEEDQRGV